MQAGNIRCNGIWCAIIVNNIIRDGKACFSRGLSGKDMLGVLTRDAISRHRAGNLCLRRDVNHHYPIGFGVQLILYQQWHHPQHVGRCRSGNLPLGLFMDQGVKERVKPALVVWRGENAFTQQAAVERAVRLDRIWTKMDCNCA